MLRITVDSPWRYIGFYSNVFLHLKFSCSVLRWAFLLTSIKPLFVPVISRSIIIGIRNLFFISNNKLSLNPASQRESRLSKRSQQSLDTMSDPNNNANFWGCAACSQVNDDRHLWFTVPFPAGRDCRNGGCTNRASSRDAIVYESRYRKPLHCWWPLTVAEMVYRVPRVPTPWELFYNAHKWRRDQWPFTASQWHKRYRDQWVF